MRWLVALTICLWPSWILAEAPAPKAPSVDVAIQRGLGFLAKDALAWKAEHKCLSCHHAALVVWAMREAKARGHAVDEPVFAELLTWMHGSGEGKTGVPRPKGIPKALNAKAVWFGLALGPVPKEAASKSDADTGKALNLLLKTVIADQLDNGGWASWPETRPPFFGNSDDSMTALATLALFGGKEDGMKAAAAKGVRRLAETKTDDDPQSVAMRLAVWVKAGRPKEEWAPLVKNIRERQNADGGWSQAKEMKSDAWATGEAIYALTAAGVATSDPAIVRGRTFLIATQRPDGSWPMTSRPTKPGDKGSPGLIPITGGGSAWGVLGLVMAN